jgi:ribosomal protein S27AE
MMKLSVRLLLMIFALASLACLVPAFAEELPAPDLAADAKMSGNRPPMVIPHEVKDDADGTACNQCHTGSFKAPHPERLNCTQCHLPGAVKKVKKDRKK